MNILLVTDYDNGGQMITLKRALCEYTKHKARLITFDETYLKYETDVVCPTLNDAEELVNWADFFILGELPRPRMQVDLLYKKIDMHNCIIRAGGTMARSSPALYMTGRRASIIKTGAYHDPTIASRIYPMANTVNMYFFDEFPKRQRDADEDPLKLVFSGTARKHRNEHSGAIMEAWKMLASDFGDKIEFVNIDHVPWLECLRLKAECDICYDQLSIGTYASSAIEGMFYNMPTFCYTTGWSRTVHPHAPLISTTTAREIYDISVHLINRLDYRHDLGEQGHGYVLEFHDAGNAIARWEGLIEFVSECYRRPAPVRRV